MPPKGWRKDRVVVAPKPIPKGMMMVPDKMEAQPHPTIRRCPGGHPVDHPQAVRCPLCNARLP